MPNRTAAASTMRISLTISALPISMEAVSYTHLECMLAMWLSLLKELPTYRDNQREHRWAPTGHSVGSKMCIRDRWQMTLL